MNALPEAIRDHVLALTVEHRTPAYLLVGDDNLLVEWGGELADYGLDAPAAGLNVDEHFPFLAGLLPLDARNLFLPYVQTESGRTADVYLFRADRGTWVLLLDATPAAAKQQNLQQRTYDLTLEVTDLRREGDELYQAKSELEQRVRERTGELARANQQLLDELARRKRVEADLRASEARFRRLADANIIGIMFWQTDGKITDANQAFLDTLGYARADVQSGALRWEQINHPDNRARDEQAFAQLAEYGACAPYQRQFVRRDGQVVALLFGAALLDGTPKQIVCFALDLSKYK
ncbi:MAG TPA: PAS domain S-box protein [Pyrinomonadaceae bacterium]|jgi:PAS domain S-box-containing protein